MKYIRVKNWERFQHYKTGKNVGKTPPWIKLYTELLNDYEFMGLPEPVRYQLIGIWIIASTCDNDIPLDVTWLKQRLDTYRTPQIQLLIDKGWLESYDGPRNVLDQSREEENSVYSIEPSTEDSVKGKQKKAWEPPTQDEVWEYMCSRDDYRAGIAKRFVDGYASNDWCDTNGNKIKNWKMKFVQVWEADGKEKIACPDCSKQTHRKGVVHKPTCRIRRRLVEKGYLKDE